MTALLQLFAFVIILLSLYYIYIQCFGGGKCHEVTADLWLPHKALKARDVQRLFSTAYLPTSGDAMA